MTASVYRLFVGSPYIRPSASHFPFISQRVCSPVRLTLRLSTVCLLSSCPSGLWSVCLSDCPSFCLSNLWSAIFLPIQLSFQSFVRPSLCPSLCLPFSMSGRHPSISLFVCLFVHLFARPSFIRQSIHQSVRPSTFLSVCCSFNTSVHQSICSSVRTFIRRLFVCQFRPYIVLQLTHPSTGKSAFSSPYRSPVYSPVHRLQIVMLVYYLIMTSTSLLPIAFNSNGLYDFAFMRSFVLHTILIVMAWSITKLFIFTIVMLISKEFTIWYMFLKFLFILCLSISMIFMIKLYCNVTIVIIMFYLYTLWHMPWSLCHDIVKLMSWYNAGIMSNCNKYYIILEIAWWYHDIVTEIS